MRFGLFGINMHGLADPAGLTDVVRHAEAAGVESVWCGEHMVFPTAALDRQLQAPTDAILDPLLALTWAAAASERLVLGTGVLLLPQRHPVALAKELASLDVLSRGRLVAGVGIGYLDAELAALGIDPRRRAGQAMEHLEAMRALWTMPEPSFAGNWVRFTGVDAYPRPVQPGGPPVVMGGRSQAALRRAVLHARGWYGFLLEPAAAGAAVDDIAGLADAEFGPGWDHFEVDVTPARWPDAADVEAFRAAGVDRLICWPQEARTVADWLAAVDQLAELAAVTRDDGESPVPAVSSPGPPSQAANSWHAFTSKEARP